MNKEVKDLVYKVVEEQEKTFDKFFNKTESCSGCIRLLNLINKNLDYGMDRIFSDLYSASRLGFVSKEEVEEYISICKGMVIYTKRNFSHLVEERFGEYEYFIQCRIINYGDTREEADKWWNYLED